MARKTQMNSITSPELLAQVCEDNKSLLNDFLDYLRSVQRSETTIAGYKSDIEIAWVWCLENIGNKPFVNWTKRNVVAYQNWLITNNDNSPARVRRLKAALSSLSNFIETVLDDEYPDFRNIIRKIESPALQPVRDKTVLDDDQVEELLNILTEKKEYKKACVVALAMFSGRRKSELGRFKVSDFGDDKVVCDGALYKSSPIQTKGRSGGKYIPCYVLKKDFDPYLKRWMEYREAHGIESEWLFPDKADPTQQIKVSTLNSWARSFSSLIGVDYYWHLCRHRYTTYLVRAGLPDSVIAEIVGWADVSLVGVYTDIDADEQISAWFKNGDIVADNKKGLSDI